MFTPTRARRSRKPTAPCTCARRSEGMRTSRRLQPAQIVRHISELAQQACIAELAGHGIAGAAEGDRADAAWNPRHYLGAAQRGARALAFLRGASDRFTAIVLQEWQCDVISDIGHGLPPSTMPRCCSPEQKVLLSTSARSRPRPQPAIPAAPPRDIHSP